MTRMSLALPLVAMIGFVAGCGNNTASTPSTPVTGNAASQTSSTSADTTQTSAKPAGDNAKTVTVKFAGTDQMQYTKKEFTVPAGATVHLIFTHTGKLPVTVMGHDVTILKKGEDAMKFGSELTAKGASPANDYLPESMRDRVLAHTKMIGAGETTEITFTAPAAGTYDYLCTFPGHYATMHGKMIVK